MYSHTPHRINKATFAIDIVDGMLYYDDNKSHYIKRVHINNTTSATLHKVDKFGVTDIAVDWIGR